MEKRQLATGSYSYIFDELAPYITTVFIVIKKEAVYVIDTYCGSDYMEKVMEDIKPEIQGKRIQLINTHFHWDHVWGNAYFEDMPILAHVLCGPLMEESWEKDVQEEGRYFKGKKKMVLPNQFIQADEKVEMEGLLIYPTPGHTRDGLSIYDKETNILYAGDNVERPIIQVHEQDLETYIGTLKEYLLLKPAQLHGSHSLDVTEEEVQATIQYLEDIKNGKELFFQDPLLQETHQQNLRYGKEE